jgi:hypothetical protein
MRLAELCVTTFRTSVREWTLRGYLNPLRKELP